MCNYVNYVFLIIKKLVVKGQRTNEICFEFGYIVELIGEGKGMYKSLAM
jgi:hypothetical protein